MTINQFFKILNGKTLKQSMNLLCGQKLGSGVHRDVFVLRGFPNYVVKIERDPECAVFANVTEWRNYINYKEWKWFERWLAPCVLINETGQILIQKRIQHRRRKDYPKYIPSVFTDLKLKNFGWIGDRFVCCDYAFLPFTLGKRQMKYAKWWGTLK